MKLSIITINRNNAAGLEKTLNSVFSQICKDFEHIIVDGASTDDSVEVIKRYVEKTQLSTHEIQYPIKWISEPDNGIYNAMNKGIKMAEGEYVQILNSGDILASDDVVARMRIELMNTNYVIGEPLSILSGNMIKDYGGGNMINDKMSNNNYTPESFLFFYNGTLNHGSTFIRRNLFDKYGYYNEEMKICSDWEWFVRVVAKGGEKVVSTDIDVTVFDMSGVSENNGKYRNVIENERREYMKSILIPSVLKDYDMYAKPILQYLRLRRHHLWSLVNFLERVLFKLEKWRILK